MMMMMEKRRGDEYSDPTNVLPNQLYLSSAAPASHPQLLKTLRITHILNLKSSSCSFPSCPCRLAKANSSPKHQKKREKKEAEWKQAWKDFPLKNYLHLQIKDLCDYPIINCFERAHSFIEDAIQGRRSDFENEERGSVLVHCEKGISRSSTIVISFLMKAQSFSLQEAYQYVLARRPIIFPNYGFLQQLVLYEQQINGHLPVIDADADDDSAGPSFPELPPLPPWISKIRADSPFLPVPSSSSCSPSLVD